MVREFQNAGRCRRSVERDNGGAERVRGGRWRDDSGLGWSGGEQPVMRATLRSGAYETGLRGISRSVRCLR